MNKEFFQQVFSQNMGFVYKYLGTVPDSESAAHYITDKFVVAAGSNLITTVVTELTNYGVTVVYYHSNTNNISSPDFELITDLIPDVIPEPVVVVQIETSEEQ
jgi:hypothetical protein